MFLNMFEFKSNDTSIKRRLALFANSKLEFIAGLDVIQIFKSHFITTKMFGQQCRI